MTLVPASLSTSRGDTEPRPQELSTGLAMPCLQLVNLEGTEPWAGKGSRMARADDSGQRPQVGETLCQTHQRSPSLCLRWGFFGPVMGSRRLESTAVVE